MKLLESPVVLSTTMDAVLGTKAEGHADIQSLRSKYRAELGAQEPVVISLGRHGRLSFEPTPLFACVQTARRWDKSYARMICDAYQTAGLNLIVQSADYDRAMQQLRQSVQACFKEPEVTVRESLRPMITGLIGKMIKSNAAFRGVAQKLHEVQLEVASKLAALERFEGQIVRMDGTGENAKVLTEERIGDRQQLRNYPASLFRELGLVNEGDLYVRTTLNWSGDNEAHVFTPAVSIEVGPGPRALEEKLNAALEPLPEPPAGWPELKRSTKL